MANILYMYYKYVSICFYATYYPTSPRNFVGITRSSGGSRGTPGPCTAAAQRAPWTTLRMLWEVLLGRKWSENCGEMTHHISQILGDSFVGEWLCTQPDLRVFVKGYITLADSMGIDDQWHCH